jgi:hypothetical protein
MAERFHPLRPASRARLAAAIVFGPIAWIVLFAVTSVVIEYTDAIALGLLIAAVSFMAAVIVLSLLRWARHREERRYADRR